MRLGVALAVLLLVSACGGGDNAEKGKTAEADAAQSASDAGDASTREERASASAETAAATPSRGYYFDPSLQRPSCGAPVNAGQYPEPELAGVRLGMTQAEAIAALLCPQVRFHVEAEMTMMDIPRRQIPAGGRLISLNNAELREQGFMAAHTVQLLAPGLAGQERVQGVWRHEEFRDEASAPAATALIAGFREQFGEPTEIREMQQGVWMNWVYSPSGARLEGRDARRCANYVASSYNGVSRAADDCGLTVQAHIRRTGGYTDVAAASSVGIVNQQALFQARNAMREQILGSEPGGVAPR